MVNLGQDLISKKRAAEMAAHGKLIDVLLEEGKTYEEIKHIINPRRAKKEAQLTEKAKTEKLSYEEIQWLKRNRAKVYSRFKTRSEERIAEIFAVILREVKDVRKSTFFMREHENNEKIFAEVIKNGIY